MMRWIGLALAVCLIAPDAGASRIKDLGHFSGVRPNQLIGYGLVVGLPGTGDSERAGFTNQSIEAMLSRMGVRVDAARLAVRNVAAVMVTAELPAFAQPGAALDVTVSSIGDARSLDGGTLILTPLEGADGATYAVAQGRLEGRIGGGGRRDPYADNRSQVNVGRVAAGARVERTVPVSLVTDGKLTFLLGAPDFTTAHRISQVVNDKAQTDWSAGDIASVTNGGTVSLDIPADFKDRVPALVAELEQVDVDADSVATIVVNGRTGTVVLGANVRLAQAAISHRGVTVEVGDGPPGGAAAEANFNVVPSAATLAEVVSGLNALGLAPQDTVDILQALARAGALNARIEVR